MTLDEMVSSVGELINQAVTDDTKTVTKTEVRRNINIGYGLVKNAVISTNQSYYLRLTKADLVADQSRYSLPDDLIRIARLEIGYSSSTTRERAQRLDRNFPDDPDLVQSEASPEYYVTGNMIELNPEPDSALTDGLWLWYIENPGDMTSGSETPDIPLGWHFLPILYATSKAKRKLGLNTEAESNLVEFEAKIEDMQDQLLRLEDSQDLVLVKDL